VTATTGSPANLAFAGHVPTGTELASWLAALQAESDPWTSYAPAWTTTGTAPAIGNGTLTGQYSQDGKKIICRGALVLGSTSTVGTGTFIISVPVAAVDANQIGTAIVWDNSANASRFSATAVFNTTSNMTFYIGTGGVVTNAAPVFSGGWAVSDKIIWQITYEAL
jgi:hypothetical protein